MPIHQWRIHRQSSVGAFRIMNNKHYLSDLLLGWNTINKNLLLDTLIQMGQTQEIHSKSLIEDNYYLIYIV